MGLAGHGAPRAGRSSADGVRHAACGGQHNWRDPNRVIPDGAVPSEARVFGLTHRVRVRISCVLTLRANLQKGVDNLVDATCEGLLEQSRPNVTDEPRRFIDVDNHETV